MKKRDPYFSVAKCLSTGKNFITHVSKKGNHNFLSLDRKNIKRVLAYSVYGFADTFEQALAIINQK